MPEIDPKIKQFYGEETLEILMGPTQLEIYTLESKASKDVATAKLNKYTIKHKSETGLSVQGLNAILFDVGIYDFEHAKRGMFFPEIGIKATKVEKSLVLLFDFFRNEILLEYAGKEKKTNFDLGRDRLIQLFQDNLGDKFTIQQTK
ncbi:MAG: hypothetical protein AAF518_07205 [Spirochaetota bacterium]